MLAQLEADVLVLDASTAEAGRQLIDGHPDADLVLLDLTLHGTDGFELLGDFRAAHPAVPVVVLSASERHVDMLRALDMGAMGYIPKSVTKNVMMQATGRTATGAATPSPRPSPRALGITDRQAEVLACILQGLPNKLICRRLDLAEGTVKIHVAAILRALNVHNRTQAVIEASRLGVTLDRLPGRESRPFATA